ncbi:MAG: hypothetical protein HC844_09070 [Tabrizicola sp.]|nr:hypothetical protein [Tabrizicola sp.]
MLLAIASSPASAQQLLNQSCTFTLTACDLQRDGSTACPAGATAEVRFRTEGESFDLVTRGVARGLEGTEDRERSFNLGSSGDSEVMRVYYIVGETGLMAPSGSGQKPVRPVWTSPERGKDRSMRNISPDAAHRNLPIDRT